MTSPGPSAIASLRSRIGKARHDLRNPLSDILGFTEILSEDAVAAGRRDLVTQFEKILHSAADLLKSVNQTLDVEMIAMNQMKLAELHQHIRSETDAIEGVAHAVLAAADAASGGLFREDLQRIANSAGRLREINVIVQWTVRLSYPAAYLSFRLGKPVA